MEPLRDSPICGLFPEMLDAILLQCPIATIFHTQLVCKRFHAAINTKFWKRYCSLAIKGKLDCLSIYHLAQIHLRFGGLKKHGLALLQSAAKLGDAQALCEFGYETIMRSNYCQTTILRGFRYIQRSATQGNDNASYLQAMNQEPNISAFTHAAEQGNPLAQHDLGMYYSAKRMPLQAKQWLKAAVANGHAPSFIALTYLHGIFLNENSQMEEDLLAAKIFLGFKLAKRSMDKPKNIAEATDCVRILAPYYAQFHEVCLGFFLQSIRSKTLHYLKHNEALSMAFKLGRIYAQKKIMPRNDQMVLHYFQEVGTIRTLTELKWKIEFDLFDCLDFINRFSSNDPLIPFLRKALHSKLRAIGNNYTIAKSIAKSMFDWLPKQTLDAINEDWIKRFLKSFDFMDSAIAAYLLYFLKKDTTAFHQAIAFEQSNTSSSLKQYLLNKRLLAFS